MSSHNTDNCPSIAVVLSSGGLKSIAAIGLFELLDQEGIQIDHLIGCSGGSIFGGMHGMGYDSSEMIAITQDFLQQNGFSKLDLPTIFSIMNVPGGKFDLGRGLFKDDLPLQMCKKVFKDTQVEDLPFQMGLQATNIQTGEGFVIREGSLAEAVYASAAMYPLLPPIYLSDQWLVDGVFTAPLPITEAVQRGADVIIAMIFTGQVQANPRKFTQGFFNVNDIFAQSLIKSQLTIAIDFHHYELIPINVDFFDYYSYTNAAKIKEIVGLGRQAIEKHKGEILAAIENFKRI